MVSYRDMIFDASQFITLLFLYSLDACSFYPQCQTRCLRISRMSNMPLCISNYYQLIRPTAGEQKYAIFTTTPIILRTKSPAPTNHG